MRPLTARNCTSARSEPTRPTRAPPAIDGGAAAAPGKVTPSLPDFLATAVLQASAHLFIFPNAPSITPAGLSLGPDSERETQTDRQTHVDTVSETNRGVWRGTGAARREKSRARWTDRQREAWGVRGKGRGCGETR